MPSRPPSPPTAPPMPPIPEVEPPPPRPSPPSSRTPSRPSSLRGVAVSFLRGMRERGEIDQQQQQQQQENGQDTQKPTREQEAETSRTAEEGDGQDRRDGPLAPTPPKPPCDLSHHVSAATRQRTAVASTADDELAGMLRVSGMGNLAGDTPNARFSAFDGVSADVALPDRWAPSPNRPIPPPSPPPRPPSSSSTTPAMASSSSTKPRTTASMTISPTAALPSSTTITTTPLHDLIHSFVRTHLHPHTPYAAGPGIILTNGQTDGLSKTLDLLVDTWIPGRDASHKRPNMLVGRFVDPRVAAQARSRGIGLVPVQADEEGVLAGGPGGVGDVLETWDAGRGERPRILHLATVGGTNPTGSVMSLPRRREIYATCQRHDVLILEDEPFWHLQYPSAAGAEAASRSSPSPSPSSFTTSRDSHDDATDAPPSSPEEFLDSLVPSFLHIDTDGRVVRLDTFEYSIAPGWQLGWITAQPAFITHLARITKTSTGPPSALLQTTLSALLLGPQPTSSSIFTLPSLPLLRPSHTAWSTPGLTRWLAGLRGSYERRMARTSALLEAGTHQLRHGTPTSRHLADWGVVSKTRLYSFSWPRGGVYLWTRVHFDAHPLWGGSLDGNSTNIGGVGDVLNGPMLSIALLRFLSKPPYLVAVAPGSLFAATQEVREHEAWRFFRLSLAAEDGDEELDAATVRFVKGVHHFWRIRDVQAMVELLG